MSRIILATDGSPGAQEALLLLIELRLRPQDVVHVVSAAEHVLAPLANGKRAEDRASEVADEAVARLRYAGCAAIVERADGPPARAIVDAALRIRADLIVLGSRGRGRWTAALLGSTARTVIHASSVPTLVVRGHPAAPRWILLAATDIRDIHSGAHALGVLQWPPEAAVEILVPAGNGTAPGTTGLTEIFEEARRALPGLDLRVHAVDPRALPSEIRRYADRLTADLIVVSQGLGADPLADAVLGSARCPVLVVPVPTIPLPAREPAGDLAVAI